ncbi:prepilin peptidase [uncultured Treponema sp.]|uniref:prepilin peptidase n=1 Tax=uncultured Treponema sp. TaxID=162155 RepID=UPI0025CC01D7|nr:prepilin peptidase [uncultured Treponema sp.]
MDRNFLILNAAYLVFALPLSYMDSRKFRISLPLLLAASVAMICVRFFVLPSQPIPLAKNLFFALASSFLLYFCTRVLTAQGLGFGDIYFGLFSALYTGFYMNLIATVFAALLGVLYYLLLAVVQKIKKSSFVHRPIFAIPFVPFITAGSVLSMLLFWVIA